MKYINIILSSVALFGCTTLKLEPIERSFEVSAKDFKASKIETCLTKIGYSVTKSNNEMVDTAPNKTDINGGLIDIYNRISIFNDGKDITYTSRFTCPTTAVGNRAISGVDVADDKDKACYYFKEQKSFVQLIEKTNAEIVNKVKSCAWPK